MDFTGMKDKVLATLGKASESAKDVAGKGLDKAKDVSKIAKLSLDVSTEKDNMKKAYLEIGRLYYDTHKDDPEGFFIQLCDEVTLAQENIAKLETEIAALKNGLTAVTQEEDITVEFEEVPAEEETCECTEEKCECGEETEACCCEEPKAEDAGCCGE